MDKKLLSILVCPLCRGDLEFDRDANELICRVDQLAYPIRDDIPIMLDNEARQLSTDEKLDK
ncbi:MAG: Trm112 family protein [Pseudomonadales bacterium]